MKGGDDEDMKKGKMGFSKILKGYFCKIVISMEVQEVVMEVQEESLVLGTAGPHGGGSRWAWAWGHTLVW